MKQNFTINKATKMFLRYNFSCFAVLLPLSYLPLAKGVKSVQQQLGIYYEGHFNSTPKHA